MKYLKPSEKMDLVLGYMKNHPDEELTTKAITGYANVAAPGAIAPNELKGILTTMANEHHIEIITHGLFRITFEGVTFMDDGGYTAQHQEKVFKHRYIRFTKKVGNESSSLMLWFLGFVIFFCAYFLCRYGYTHWNWKIPF